MQIRTVSLQNLVKSSNNICYLTQEKYLIFFPKNALGFKQEKVALYNGTGWQKETE